MGEHDSKQSYQRYYDRYKRNTQAKRFYNSKEWLRVREYVLQRDNYLCQPCLNEHKKITKANTVHHIIPLLNDWTKATEEKNLESICMSCHAKEHDEKLNKQPKQPARKVRVIQSKSNEMDALD